MRALELVGAVVATACIVSGGLVLAASASAAPGADAAGRLLLGTDPDPLGVHDLPPGGEVDWQVIAALDAETGSDLDLQVEATGPMTTSAAGMRLSVSRCSVAWSSLSFPAGDAASVLDTIPVVDVVGGAPSHVTHLSRTGSTHLLVRLTLPTSAGNAFVGTGATVRLVLTAAGDVGTVGTGPDPTAGSLAATGVSVAGPALLGVGILAAGVVVAARRRRRTEAVLA